MKFDRQLRPATETSQVVSYGGKTIPRWRMAAILKIDISSYLSEKPGNQVATSLGNSGLCWTVFARNRDTAVLAEGNGDYQTLICVLVARPRRCLTLSNPVTWQNWMAAYLGYAVSWLTNYGKWHAYEKKKKWKIIRFSWNFVHSSRFLTGWTSRCACSKWNVAWTDSEFDRTYFLFKK